MTNDVIKSFGRYGAASVIAMYLVYVMINDVKKNLEQLTIFMQQSVAIQQQLVRSMEENNQLQRAKFSQENL